MPLCPVCKKDLETISQRQGIYYHCSTCNGRGLSIPQIRRVAGDHLAIRVLRLLKARQEYSDLLCPFCSKQLLILKLQEPALEFAGCKSCSIVWFDAQNYQLLPE